MIPSSGKEPAAALRRARVSRPAQNLTRRRGRASILAASIAVLLAGAALPARAQTLENIVVNGGFETGDFTGWSLSGPNPDVAVESSPGAHSGNFFASFGTVGATSSITQVLSTVPGVTYTLTFYLANSSSGTPNSYAATYNGSTLVAATNAHAFGYTEFTYTIAATTTTGTLSFAIRQDPSFMELDDVSMTVPSPSTAYWTGAQSSVWTDLGSRSNWSTTANGLSDPGAYPGANTDVIFSAGNVTPGSQTNTTLGADLTIHSLTITDPNAVGINGANTLTISAFGGAAITVASGAGPVTIGANVTLAGPSNIIDVSNASLVINGVLGGTVGLDKAGTGTLILNGANNYTGGTTLNGGQVGIGNSSALGTGTVTVNAATNVTIFAVGGDQTVGNDFTLGTNLFVGTNLNGTHALTLNGQISGNGGLIIGGTGALILNGANSYHGGTNLSFGMLGIGNSSALSTGEVFVFGGSIFAAGADQAIGNILDLASNLVVVNDPNGPHTLTLNGQIGDIGAVIMNGTGTLILNGVNSYFGGTHLNSGTIGIGNSSASSTGTVTVGGTGGSIFAAGADQVVGNNFTLNSGLTVVGDPSGMHTLTLNGQITGAGGLTMNGPGTLILTAANSYLGGTALNAGTIGIGTALALGTVTVTVGGSGGAIYAAGADQTVANEFMLNAGLTVSGDPNGANTLTLNGRITGNGGLTMNGTGTLILNGPNSYLGGTNLNAGTIGIGNATALGSGQVAVGASGGSIYAAGADQAINNNFVLQNTLTVVDDPNGPHTLTLNGQISSGGLVMNGTGTLILNGVNSYGGGTALNSGTIGIGNSSALGLNLVFVGVGGGSIYAAGADQAINNLFQLDGALTVVTDPTGAHNLLLQGAISGAASLNVNTPGATVELTGNNSYMGGTTVTASTLIVDSNTGSGALEVKSGAVLSGGGTVAGTVTLYGLLAPGRSISGNTLHTGMLNWQPGGGLNFLLGTTSDQLAITGSLFKSAPGTYDIAIGNSGGIFNQSQYILATFTTGTNFTASDFTLVLLGGLDLTGHFQITSNQLDFDLTGAPVNGPIIDNSAPINTPTYADFTANGPVTTAGGNNLIHTLSFTPGSSLLINNTLYVGQGPVVLVGNSAITLNGNLSASALEMLAGSFLNGNGWIFGNLINNGTVSPGDAPGIIHVSGNYTQGPSGLLQIQIGGRGLGRYSLLGVNGVAALGGTLQLERLDNYKLRLDEPVTFLTATGGIVGKFASIENGFTTDNILVPTVVYHGHSVALEAEQGSFAQFAARTGLTPNEQAVGKGLDSVAGKPRARSLFNYLDYQSLSQLPKDLEKLSPDQLTSIFTTSIAYAQQQSLNLQNRTEDIRNGAAGFSGQRFAMTGNTPSYSGNWDITTSAGRYPGSNLGEAGPTGFRAATGSSGPSGDDGKEMKETKEVAPGEDRWGAFVSGTGEWVNVSGTENARGYDLSSGGFTMGVDYKVTSNFAVGLAAGYTGTTADLADHGRVWANGGKLGLYSTVFEGGWYADLAGFGGYNSYDTRRSALQGDARGDTHGGEIDGLIGTGYDVKKGALTFGPTATFDYTYAGTEAFTEHNSLAPLSIHGGEAESLRTAFGAKVSYDWKIGGLLLKPELHAAWQHEFGDTVYALDSSFAGGAGSAFRVGGPKSGRDSAQLGAGFALQCSEACSLYLYYDGNIGRTNYQSESVTGGLRLAF